MTTNDIHRDKLLFAAIAEGDADAFHRLFQLYYHPLRNNAFKLLKSEYWAEEVAQEVFLNVWDNRDRLAKIENPAAWLYRITSHRCFDRIRSQELEVRTQYALNRLHEDANTFAQQNNYDLEFLLQLINEAVERLPEQQRLVYILQQDEGLTYKKIAEKLCISPHTVRNHLVKACEAVRKYIQSYGGFLLLIFFLVPF